MADKYPVKGIVFNLFENFVSETWDEDTWDEILDGVELVTQEPFVGPGNYPDEDLVALAVATCERVKVDVPAGLRAFGKYAFPHLAAVHPEFVDAHDNAKSFLASAESVIHVEVRKLMPDAEPARILCEDTGPGRQTLRYVSGRKLCAFVEGLLDGIGERFGETIAFQKTQCLIDGADCCEYDLTFSPVSVEVP